MKHRRTREIIIELTSLLDVVMILIFAVLLQNAELLDKKNQEIAGIEAENTGLLENISGLQDRLEALEGDNDKLSQELQEALDKINQGKVDELMAQLDKYENMAEAFEAIKGDVEVYYIKAESINVDPNPNYFKYTEVTYGVANAKETTVRLDYTDENGIKALKGTIEAEIIEYLKKNMQTGSKEKNYYVVTIFPGGNVLESTAITLEVSLRNDLKNYFDNDNHIKFKTVQ